jgi:hypothetical protein
MRWLVTASALLVLGAAFLSTRKRGDAVAPASFDISAAPLPAGGEITALAVGHEFRQDDSPSIAAAPDGSLWVAWLSFDGDRDDVAIRRYQNGKWGALQWVPGSSGDNWLPQVAVDSASRPWVVWSQQVNGNWDLYARRFDPARQEWSVLERLTSAPLPDINPRLASDDKGHFALVWQGFRGKNGNIFLKTFDGEKWSDDVRVTNHAANDWEPAVALDSKGNAWVAYDSYKNGNYDVFLWTQGREIPVATTADFEARASIAIDSSDRVWVAYEAGRPNWGKDQGYEIRGQQPGVPLGGFRRPQIRCYENGQWRVPQKALAAAFKGVNTYQPHVFSDSHGSVWVAAKIRMSANAQNANMGYWEYWITHFDGSGWTESFALPNSKGRSSTHISAVATADGLWVAWPTDNRVAPNYHRPHRQQVLAGRIPAAGNAGVPVWASEAAPEVVAKPGHADEPGDLAAIHAYTARVDGKPLQIVRGDFHRHTELSWDGGGGGDGNLQDFYRYMIDVAAMDFGASTDHQGGAWPYWWWYTQKMTDMYHVPGAYVPIFGYERSAVFPNGHRNVFFAKRSESRVTPFHLRSGAQGFMMPLGPLGDEPGVGTGELVADDTKLLYEDIRPRNGIAIPHTSATRMGTDWRDNDPNLEPVVEIYQGARTNYEQLGAPLAADVAKDAQHMQQAGYQPEGFVNNAWAKGYKLGITSSSDHGSTHISYTLVYTADPSRQGVLDAIRQRHTYGAMDNIIVDVRMGRHFMGDEFTLGKAEALRVRLRGTRPIARVDVIKDSQVIYSTQPNQQEVAFEFRDTGDLSGRHYYYVRTQQEDKMLAWSSPMFVNYK